MIETFSPLRCFLLENNGVLGVWCLVTTLWWRRRQISERLQKRSN